MWYMVFGVWCVVYGVCSDRSETRLYDKDQSTLHTETNGTRFEYST
jgi:hypothetical protein